MSSAAVFTLGNIEVRDLAPRQAETLAHTVRGLSSKETARVMHISPRTVEMNISLAMQRLGARNRAQLIHQAISTGALTIKRVTPSLLVCFLFAFAALPYSTQSVDDILRLTARPVRVRRELDADLPEPKLPEA